MFGPSVAVLKCFRMFDCQGWFYLKMNENIHRENIIIFFITYSLYIFQFFPTLFGMF